MSRPIPPDPNLSPDASELEMLSAYLDNALPAVERAVLEQRLSVEPALRKELEALRSTLTVLNNAPALAPPRNFTLDPAQYHRPTPANRRTLWLPVSVIGAAAALLLVALIASQSLSGLAPQLNRPVSASSAAGQVALAPTVLPTEVALQPNSSTATSSSAAKSGATAAAIAPLQATAGATQSAADAAVQVPETPTRPPAIAAPLRPTSTLAQMTAVLQVATNAPALALPTVAAANSGAAPSQNGATNASGAFAGPSLAVPGAAPSPQAPLVPPTQVAQVAPVFSTPLPPSDLSFLAILIRWLLILLGVKG